MFFYKPYAFVFAPADGDLPAASAPAAASAAAPEKKRNPRTILRIEQAAVQELADMRRIIGFVGPRGVLDLFDFAELNLSPRKPVLSNRLVKTIVEQLKHSPKLFGLRANGVCVACFHVLDFERNRFALELTSDVRHHHEDLLDGAYLLFATVLHVLNTLLDRPWPDEDTREAVRESLESVKGWKSLKSFWKLNGARFRDELTAIEREITKAHDPDLFPGLNFRLPVEVLSAKAKDIRFEQYFGQSIIEIARARTTAAEQSPGFGRATPEPGVYGLFDPVMKYLPETMKPLIAWDGKTTAEHPMDRDTAMFPVVLILLALQREKLLPTLLSDMNRISDVVRLRLSGSYAIVHRVLTAAQPLGIDHSEVQILYNAMKLLQELPTLLDLLDANFEELFDTFVGVSGDVRITYGRVISEVPRPDYIPAPAPLTADEPCRYRTPGCVRRAGSHPLIEVCMLPLYYALTAFMRPDGLRRNFLWLAPVKHIRKIIESREPKGFGVLSLAGTMENYGNLIIQTGFADERQDSGFIRNIMYRTAFDSVSLLAQYVSVLNAQRKLK